MTKEGAIPMERLSMRKIKEVLRLKWDGGLSHRAIAASCAVAASTVLEYVRRAERAGLSWPLPEGLTEAELEARLFPPPPAGSAGERPLPEWAQVHKERRRKGVTLFLLWQEYKEVHPDGYQYSQFCERYRCWAAGLEVCLRQDHKAGEKLFVDYAGQTAGVVDPSTGAVRQAQIFVAVLGASNYTYAEATWTQTLPDWVASHIRAWEAIGGVTAVVVPDNLRTGVSAACRYEPDLNPTYQELASHYGTAIVPARAAKPRDKAKVECGVQGVERSLLAPLRHRTFFSLAELNHALRERLVAYNARPFQKLPGSRRSLFETLDQPALRPLPPTRYEFAQWKKAQVHIDYHVEVEGHYYSVPYQLVRQAVELRLTATTVECFHNGRRVASHPRSVQKGRHTTLAEHMPKAHRAYLDWTPERLVRWAGHSGPATAAVVEAILATRPHPQQGYRSCLGLMRLGKLYGPERLEAACRRALSLQTLSYRSLASILQRGLDRQSLPERPSPQAPIAHSNVRGARYYGDAH
jgi:transposase